MQPLQTTALPGSVSHRPFDLRPVPAIGHHRQAGACCILLLASFWSWAVIFDKALRLRRLRAGGGELRGELLVGRLARRSLRPRRPAPARPDERGVRRGDARMAAQRRQGPARHRGDARQPAAAHRAGDERHGRPRDGARRALHELSRHGRLDRAVRRPVRHGLGHHGQLPVDRRLEEHQPRRRRPGHRRSRCSRPRSASSPRSRRSSPTTSCRPISAAMPAGSRPSPANSARSCRASSTRGPEPMAASMPWRQRPAAAARRRTGRCPRST